MKSLQQAFNSSSAQGEQVHEIPPIVTYRFDVVQEAVGNIFRATVNIPAENHASSQAQTATSSPSNRYVDPTQGVEAVPASASTTRQEDLALISQAAANLAQPSDLVKGIVRGERV